MQLSEYSRNRIRETFAHWKVDKDFADPIYNYLVYGFEPGSCFTAVLANDFFRAMQSSHPVNTIQAFKNLVGWINEVMPIEAYGSYLAVNHWLKLTSDDRRRVLENHQLIYTAKEETWLNIKGDPTHDPIIW
jgi:hypothetical protein